MASRRHLIGPSKLGLVVWVTLVPIAVQATTEPTAPPSADSVGQVEPAAAQEEAPPNPFLIKPERREGEAFVKSDDPESTVPTPEQRDADKLQFGYYLMELTDKAMAALESKDYEMAAKYFRAMGKAVPDRAVAWSKLCEVYDAMGNAKEAEQACQRAINLEGTTVGDHTRYVDLYLRNRPGTLTPQDVQGLDRILAHLGTFSGAETATARANCRLAARLEDAKRLRPCVEALNAKLPHDSLSISYSWALAVAEDDSDAAEEAIRRAEAAGLPAEVVLKMRESGKGLLGKGWSPRLRWGLVAFTCVALALAGYFYSGRRRRGLAHA